MKKLYIIFGVILILITLFLYQDQLEELFKTRRVLSAYNNDGLGGIRIILREDKTFDYVIISILGSQDTYSGKFEISDNNLELVTNQKLMSNKYKINKNNIFFIDEFKYKHTFEVYEYDENYFKDNILINSKNLFKFIDSISKDNPYYKLKDFNEDGLKDVILNDTFFTGEYRRVFLSNGYEFFYLKESFDQPDLEFFKSPNYYISKAFNKNLSIYKLFKSENDSLVEIDYVTVSYPIAPTDSITQLITKDTILIINDNFSVTEYWNEKLDNK